MAAIHSVSDQGNLKAIVDILASRRTNLRGGEKKDEKENVDNEYRSVSRPENRNDMDRRIDVIKATNSGVPAGSLAPDVPSVSYRAVIALLDGSVQVRASIWDYGCRSYVKSRSSLYADALERYNTDAMAGRMPTYKRHHRKLRSSEPRLATRLTRSLIARRKDALRTIRKEAAQREGGSLGELD
ncbi:hypothetical protein V1477_005028 [Vespula maculifrons]|uniref:Uncharacterized protein n=1 Tax=Vespula maculifrons TaxID=7453 RepID=A0ABD2CR55_VESMC